MKPEEVAKALADFGTVWNLIGDSFPGTPCRSSDRDEFVAEVTRDHRTIQQNVGRVIVALLEEWARACDDGEFDARNEGICQFAKAAIQANRNLPYL